MKDPYRILAPFYSQISGWVFGDRRREANVHFLGKYPLDKVLIIGGGDGADYSGLEEQLTGDYWEKSPAMLRLAKRNLEKSGLQFHLGDFSGTEKYEIICLPFVLDSFLEEELEVFLVKISSHLRENGRVLFSDFFPPVRFGQKFLYRLMITFHRLLAGYRRKEVPNYSEFFEKTGWYREEEKTWANGWIRAQVYRRAD